MIAIVTGLWLDDPPAEDVAEVDAVDRDIELRLQAGHAEPSADERLKHAGRHDEPDAPGGVGRRHAHDRLQWQPVLLLEPMDLVEDPARQHVLETPALEIDLEEADFDAQDAGEERRVLRGVRRAAEALHLHLGRGRMRGTQHANNHERARARSRVRH